MARMAGSGLRELRARGPVQIGHVKQFRGHLGVVDVSFLGGRLSPGLFW